MTTKLTLAEPRTRLAALRQRHAEDTGAIATLVVLLIPVLLLFTMIAVDVSRWYLELQRLQRAADAAALAGAPFMPDALGPASNAVSAAQAAGQRNGVTIAASDLQQGARSSQLRVTARGSVANSFAGMIGINTTSLARSAVAEFTGPAPMGSPCNTFGNEPAAGTAGPSGSQLGTPNLANCSTNPQFWAKIQGPNTEKLQGDRFMTRVCGTRPGTPNLPDGCANTTTNSEFRSEGYFFILRVAGSAVGQPVRVQVYDPAWVQTGTNCSSLANPSTWAQNLNPFTTDARSRYDNSPTPGNPFCNGDYDPASGSPPRAAARVDTTYLVREPDESLNPLNAPVISNCTSQFRGYSSAPTRNQLTSGNGSYDADLARVFHQWVTLCTIPNAKAGDYYIQVRTNRKLPDSGTRSVWLASEGNGPGSSVSPSSNADDPSANGRGSNSFVMRAFVPNNLSASRGISVAGQDRMPIFMNAAAGNATFNLIRVTPGSRGQTIQFSVYDVGDAASTGTVTVLPPIEANNANPNPYAAGFGAGTGTFAGQRVASGCSSSNVNVSSNLTNCSVGISNSVNNGRVQRITVPVPSNYECDVLSSGGCWFRLNVRFGSGTVNDITTWTASLDGDPVRLEE